MAGGSTESNSQLGNVLRPKRNVDLGKVLRKARKAAGLTQGDAGKKLGLSQPTLARIESGERPLAPGELATLVMIYNPAEKIHDEIQRLTTLPDTPGSDDLSPNPHFLKMLEAQDSATEILSYHNGRIPMPLQSQQYAVKQYQLVDSSISVTDVLRAWEDRRRILTRTKPPRYRAILTLPSLEFMPGGNTALSRQQAQHLAKLIETYPQLSLQILCKTAEVPYLPNTDFTLLRMPGMRHDLVYVPIGMDGQLYNSKAKVDEYMRYWHDAQRAALSEEDTGKLLNELANSGETE